MRENELSIKYICESIRNKKKFEKTVRLIKKIELINKLHSISHEHIILLIR